MNYNLFTSSAIALSLFLNFSIASQAQSSSKRNQIHLAREIEAISALSSILRYQQVYHYEKNRFITTIRDLEINSGISVGQMITLSGYNVKIEKADRNQVIIIVKATREGLHSFAGFVKYNSDQQYKVISCRTNSPSYYISPPIDAETCGNSSNPLYSYVPTQTLSSSTCKNTLNQVRNEMIQKGVKEVSIATYIGGGYDPRNLTNREDSLGLSLSASTGEGNNYNAEFSINTQNRILNILNSRGLINYWANMIMRDCSNIAVVTFCIPQADCVASFAASPEGKAIYRKPASNCDNYDRISWYEECYN
ncbi:type IV pilin-like G/H family protein [Geminocystis herdmanii]|uniref:type IV pilin-like G/H family protein n=1 Tax=Geminocystis herdmanii TaxID=669359 RepID=UPI0003472FA0|nr:type IV pilin-like G/H family protein [Geminocystis herdmanii]